MQLTQFELLAAFWLLSGLMVLSVTALVGAFALHTIKDKPQCSCDGCVRQRHNLGGYKPCVKEWMNAAPRIE